MSWRLEPQSDLVVELHLMPGDEPQPVKVSVGLYFTDKPPSRTGYMLQARPAGYRYRRRRRRDYVNTDSYTLPVDVDALAVQPHAHFLAKEARAWATLPGGDDCAAHLHQGLELPLAGRLHVRAAAGVAEGHGHRDALHVRQLRRESIEPASASSARDIWPDQRVGNGFAVAAGRAAPAGGSRIVSKRTSHRKFCATISPATRSGSRSSRATRRCARSSRRVIWRRIVPPTRWRNSRRRCAWIPRPAATTTSAACCCMQQDYAGAENAFRKALALKPALSEALYGLAVVKHGQHCWRMRLSYTASALRRGSVERRGTLQPRPRAGGAGPDRPRDSEL